MTLETIRLQSPIAAAITGTSEIVRAVQDVSALTVRVTAASPVARGVQLDSLIDAEAL